MDVCPTTRKTRDGVQGWLKRKGGPLHTWSWRWCVLNEKALFLFVRQDDLKSRDCIALDKQVIVEPPPDYNDPKQGYFSIISDPKDKSDSLHLMAETDEDKKLWSHMLKKALYADKGGALFSQTLEDIVFWEKKQGRRIPYIVDECVEYLYKYALDTEGIFRLPGRQTAIKDIIARFEQGQTVSFEEHGTDVHVVASVLKHFLRELPDSIIPCEHFQKFMNIAMKFMSAKNHEEKEVQVDDLTSSMNLIPRDNYVILKYVCTFLREVGLHESTNKMTMSSLGRVFGYNIIRHIDRENSQLFLVTADLSENLVFMLLHYFDQVFTLEYKEDTSPELVVPTADILNIFEDPGEPVTGFSQSVNPSVIADLEGLDLSFPPTDSSKDSRASLRWKDNHFSNGDNSSNNLPTNGDDVSSLRDSKKTLLQLSLSDPIVGSDQSQSPTSPNSNSLEHPVAPKRSRSTKIGRNRKAMDRKRPEGYVFVDGQRSFIDACDPVLPTHSSIPSSISPSISPASTLSRCSSLNDPDQDPVVSSFEILSSVSECKKLVNSEYLDDAKLRPQHNDLVIQVEALKKELGVQKSRYKERVGALKTQLKDICEKYERTIDAMQAEDASQKKDLENKLATEREACAAAVANTIKLKGELHKYQMQYGEMPS